MNRVLCNVNVINIYTFFSFSNLYVNKGLDKVSIQSIATGSINLAQIFQINEAACFSAFKYCLFSRSEQIQVRKKKLLVSLFLFQYSQILKIKFFPPIKHQKLFVDRSSLSEIFSIFASPSVRTSRQIQ